MTTNTLEMPKELKFVCKLADILEERKMTATALHLESGVSKTTISNLTRGARIDRIDRFSTGKLLEALNCSFDDLWNIYWEEK